VQLQVAAGASTPVPTAIEVGYAAMQAAAAPERSAATGPSHPAGTAGAHCDVRGHPHAVPAHTEPAAQVTQAPPQLRCPVAQQTPLEQTSPVPQEVPLATLVVVSVHTGAPVEHASEPTWQIAEGGVHTAPAKQGLHVPPLQTSPLPHGAPSATLPDSAHRGLPVLHVVVPVRHGLAAIGQVWPALQAAHVPWLQTMSVPQAVPSASGVV
jgi:hypothetical protein